ncbi:hypothetical protein [Neisseria canis]|uniref:hypothetical protein n=1 Tax=Neisseria canis TaxID=493 RepID=UPI001302078B|nr:hypothetical protein [Neisseria canis]
MLNWRTCLSENKPYVVCEVKRFQTGIIIAANHNIMNIKMLGFVFRSNRQATVNTVL